MEALASESISKSVNLQQEMPQVVDAYMSIISKPNTFHNQITKGVKTVCDNVYAQYTEIILQSQIFASNVKGGMAVIAAKASQDYENLKDAFNVQISRNNTAWSRITAVLRERQDAENALAVQLDAEKLQMEANKENAEQTMARVQNTQRMEMQDNEKKAEDNLRKQRLELASTKREMKADKKQWQRAFAEFQKQLEEKLKEVPKETRHSIRSLAKSVADDDKPENPEGNPNQPKDGAFMETPGSIKWGYSRKSGKWEIVKSRNADDVSIPPSTPPSSTAGSGGESTSGGGRGGGRRGNDIWVGTPDETLHPPFPTGNDPHDSSSSSDSSNNSRRHSLGGIPPLPPGGSTMYSGSVRGRSPGRKYEKKLSQMKLTKVFKGDPSEDTLPYQKWFHSVEYYMKWHGTDFEDDIDNIIWTGSVIDGMAGT